MQLLRRIALTLLAVTVVALAGYVITDVLADPGSFACKVGGLARRWAQFTGFTSLVACGFWIIGLAARSQEH